MARAPASGWRCWCPASTRRRPSPRWSPISAPRCRRPRSTSTTTIPPTAPPRSPAPPARVVRRETHQGKGNVVRRMFADVDADIYVLVDGDATYDAPSARAMIARLIEDRLDMVVAARVDQEEARLPPRPSHRQPAAHRLLRLGVRRDLHRHSLRLPRVLAPVREVVSGAVARVRDRDRADRARARARAAGGRGRDALLRAAGRARRRSSAPGATVCASCSPSSGSTARSGRLPFFSGARHRPRDRFRSSSRSRSS